jgi:hypothetical protein
LGHLVNKKGDRNIHEKNVQDTKSVIFQNIRLSLIERKTLVNYVNDSGYFAAEDIVKAIKEQENNPDALKYRMRKFSKPTVKFGN